MNYMKGYKFQLQKDFTCFVSDENHNKELHTYYSLPLLCSLPALQYGF